MVESHIYFIHYYSFVYIFWRGWGGGNDTRLRHNGGLRDKPCTVGNGGGGGGGGWWGGGGSWEGMIPEWDIMNIWK